MTDGTRALPTWLWPAATAGAVALAVALALFQPWLLFVDEEVDEQLPTAWAPGDADGVDLDEPNIMPDEGEMMEMEDIEEEIADANAQPDEEASEPMPEPAPSGPTVLAAGDFVSRSHGTSGHVEVVEFEDGSRVLTIEDLQTDNGPDLYVYLDTDGAQAEAAAYDDGVDLGRLRGNVGNLVYEIPDDLDLDDLDTVAIWCDRFGVVFGAADLIRG